MNLNKVSQISSVCGHTLNTEEVTGLENSMLQRELEEKKGKMQFWGKIYGTVQDYLIVFSRDMSKNFPSKKFYFCTTSDYTMKALPLIDAEYRAKAEGIKTSFLGDPSFFSYEGEPVEETGPPVERFREIHRLAQTVERIDHDCAIVPKGALCVDAEKKIISSGEVYQGLDYEASGKLSSYFHLRPPESIKAVANLKKPGLILEGDFLDCIDKDTPDNMWLTGYDVSCTAAFVRNIYWEGYSFILKIGSQDYGGVYFGTGNPNYDYPFMT